MSADNGYILRINEAGEYVLQMFFMSNDEYPSIDRPNAHKFRTLEAALLWHEHNVFSGAWSEYGLYIEIDTFTRPIKKEESTMLETQKYVRKPFEVEAVQVTSKNMELVAAWCGGKIGRVGKEGRDDRYIEVKDPKPHSPRHTRAFVGDWVVFAGKGHKVYLNKPFERSFDEVEGGRILHPEVDTNKEELVELLVTDEPAEPVVISVQTHNGDIVKSSVPSAHPSPAFLASLAKARGTHAG